MNVPATLTNPCNEITDPSPVELVRYAKRGRPRIEDRNKPKPWLAAGMSRRTWFRRQTEKRRTEP